MAQKFQWPRWLNGKGTYSSTLDHMPVNTEVAGSSHTAG